MIAKLIVWGSDRAAACAQLHQALGEFQILGVANNVSFLARVATSASFLAADLDTALIEREQAHLFPAPATAPAAAVLAAALELLSSQRAAAASGSGLPVWRRGGGWRLNGEPVQRVVFRSQETERTVLVRPTAEGFQLELDGIRALAGSALTVDGLRVSPRVVADGARYDVFLDGAHHTLEHIDPLAHVGEHAVAEGGIRALMPGRVVALLVEPGTRISKGQPLLILEAMKMEHTLHAPADGVCEGFNVAVGDQVSEGAELVQFKAV